MFRFATILLLTTFCGCNSRKPTDTGDESPPALTATVVSYDHNAVWDHFDDGSFATYDQLTLDLDSGQSFPVAVPPDDLPDNSPFCISGTRFKFALSEPFDPEARYYWGAIDNPTILK